ncbi:thioredoxin-like protein [Rhodocollybia butyracea]|uniref:Thioredoxin-like protein n=1 Tax=Rhodocollybia butyracea TaxID=206335 RepID=A0A9P5UGD8_9AGAR|nr:thioredoxin-like protein [Rhodocollybia butyracea]
MTQSKQSHPDADVYPEATGPAKNLVLAHADEQPLKLYGSWFCPFVQRVWTVLEEKKIPYQYIEVNPYEKPESLMRLNPRGLVPTLQYQGKPLYESTVIGEFLEDAYPDHTPHLVPEDPYNRARIRIWTDFVTSRIIPSWHRFLQFQHKDGQSEQEAMEGLKKVRDAWLGHIREFTQEMDVKGPFFAGPDLGWIDIVVAPWMLRSWVFDYYKGGSGIPEEGQEGDDQVWKRYRKYNTAIHERRSIQETTSEREHYLPIYQRYADDIAQSEMAKATREGRGVP